MESSREPRYPNRLNSLLGLFVPVTLIALSLAALARPDRQHLWGDEGTFTAMTASLVRDGDLRFGTSDEAWATTRHQEQGVTLILQRTSQGITYSKPVVYPLLSAPLFALFGENGMLITQSLAFVLALALTWLHLRQLADAQSASWTLATFAVCSVALVYLGWQMSDSLLLSLTLAGLLLAGGGRESTAQGRTVRLPFGSIWAAGAGGILLGAGTSMRYTSAALLAAAALALIVDKRWRRAAVVGVTGVVAFIVISGLTASLLGTANPYKAVRSSFNQETGYPVAESTGETDPQFTERPATQTATWRPSFDGRRTAYSSLFFLIGRHTGVLFYFPASLALLLTILRRPDRVSLTLLGGAAIVVAFYLIWMPENYYGGSTFVGNRYFLTVFPVLPVALDRAPSRRNLVVAWVLGAIAWGSAAYSTHLVRDLDASSQSHAYAGVFRLLPAESTARRIDGQQERFWADDYLRFLDPFARPARWSFQLDAARPAAEILVATSWSGSPLKFVIAPRSAPVEVVVDDWKGGTRLVVPQEPPSPPGLVSVPVSQAWRRHAFWWRPGNLYRVRVLRFTLLPREDGETTAVIRYVGRGRKLAPLAGEIVNRKALRRLDATADQRTDVLLRIRNTGRRPWKTGGLFPHRLTYRLLTEEGEPSATRQDVALPSNLSPGQTLALPVSIRWPTESGPYSLVFEIVREPIERLGDLGHTELARVGVMVEPPLSPDTPEP